MNSSPMMRRFCSGSSTPARRREEPLPGVDHHQLHAQVLGEGRAQQLRLALAHQPVVDVDAGQLVADRPMHERRGHRRVHAAGQRADDRPSPIRCAARDVGHCRPDEGRRRPCRRAPRRCRRRSCAGSRLPRGVWTTSGWNWMPYSPRSGSASPANAVESLWAVGTKPSGGRRIESPWLIQTGCSRSMPRKRPSSDVIWTDAGPYSRFALGTTSPPSSWAISCSP